MNIRTFLKHFFVIASLLSLMACARTCESLDRKIQAGSKHYHVKQWSGGKLIGEWKFYGIVNSSSNSDGYYFTIGDSMYEVSGDVRIIFKN